MKYRLFHRDPKIMFYYNPHITGQDFIPTQIPNKQPGTLAVVFFIAPTAATPQLQPQLFSPSH